MIENGATQAMYVIENGAGAFYFSTRASHLTILQQRAAAARILSPPFSFSPPSWPSWLSSPSSPSSFSVP
jgi:hypothetical protein